MKKCCLQERSVWGWYFVESYGTMKITGGVLKWKDPPKTF